MSVRDSSCSWKRSWSTCLVVLASFPYGPMVACHTCADKLSIGYRNMELWEFLEAMSQPSLPWLTTVGCMTFAWKANQSNSINMNHRKVKQQFSQGNNQNLLKACSAVHAPNCAGRAMSLTGPPLAEPPAFYEFWAVGPGAWTPAQGKAESKWMYIEKRVSIRLIMTMPIYDDQG